MKRRNWFIQDSAALKYLLDRLEIGEADECWEWKIGKDKDGYGQMQSTSHAKAFKVTKPHQLSFRLFSGKIPAKHFICHTCDNPSCCNPLHLFAGTGRDNARDMFKKGRQRDMSKSARKIPTEDYEKIRAAQGTKTCFELAKEYNVSFARICQIWRGDYYEYRRAKKEAKVTKVQKMQVKKPR